MILGDRILVILKQLLVTEHGVYSYYTSLGGMCVGGVGVLH
jgi:hypothetical protein